MNYMLILLGFVIILVGIFSGQWIVILFGTVFCWLAIGARFDQRAR